MDTQDTGRIQTKQKSQHRKLKRRDLTKCRGSPQVLAKGKQFLLLIRHPPCYSYIQTSQGRKSKNKKKQNKKTKKQQLFEIWIFRNAQPNRDVDRRKRKF